MSILCDPNINNFLIHFSDVTAMIDINSELQIYGNTSHNVVKLIQSLITTTVISIHAFTDNSIIILSSNNIVFVILNTHTTPIVKKIIPNTQWKQISMVSVDNSIYGINVDDKFEMVNIFFNKDELKNTYCDRPFYHILSNESNIKQMMKENDNVCILYTNGTLTFYGDNWLSFNNLTKHDTFKKFVMYDHNRRRDNVYDLHLITTNNKYKHYLLNNDIQLIKSHSNITHTQIQRLHQIIICDDKTINFYDNGKTQCNHIMKDMEHLKRIVESPNIVAFICFIGRTVIIDIDGNVYDNQITSKTRPFTNTILM